MAEGAGGTAQGEGPQLVDADVLIDEILSRKGPHRYTQGLSEENWEEELEQIPLFMTRSPEAIDPEKAPALAALQDLKYQEDTPHGRAMAYKEDGNEHFRKKRYTRAVKAYTAGVREGSSDASLNTILYCNRAAAHFHLGNHRSSLMDATQAKKLKPDHMKALTRGALVCVELRKYGEALEWCDEGLRVEPENAKLREIHTKAVREKKRQERDQRRERATEKTKRSEEEKLLEAIQSRGIHLAEQQEKQHRYDDSDEEGISPKLSMLSLSGSHPSGERVHLDSEGGLIWPVLFLYPEHGQTDFIAAFHENHRFMDHLTLMFGQEPAPWDSGRKYTPSNIEIYYEEVSTNELVRVPLDSTLGTVLSSGSYTVVSGTPSFVILAAGSPFREHFVARQK